MKKLPFMSIVLCSYNGEETIRPTLETICAQDYPSDRYEIIVVDDGSKDNTAEIAASFQQVKVISLPHNQGVSAARNAGLAAAKGTIFVGADDDCDMGPSFLRELAKCYDGSKPIGVGGKLITPASHRKPSLIERFVIACDTGPAVVNHPILNPGDLSIFGRFLRYLMGQGKIHAVPVDDATSDEIIEVVELYGANGSFPVAALRKIGGWRSEYFGIEDRDISNRLRQAYPDRPFFVNPKARLYHNIDNPDISMKNYMLRPLRRGPVILRYHQANNLIPPVFPFPVAYVAMLLIALAVDILLLPIVAIVLPLILYYWWAYKAFNSRTWYYLLFPYFTLAEELLTIIGIVRGYGQKLFAKEQPYRAH